MMKLLKKDNNKSAQKEAKKIFNEKYGNVKEVSILIRHKEALEERLRKEDDMVLQYVFNLLTAKIDRLKVTEQIIEARGNQTKIWF